MDENTEANLQWLGPGEEELGERLSEGRERGMRGDRRGMSMG